MYGRMLSLVIDICQDVGPEIGWQLPGALVGVLLALSIIIYILVRILTHRHEEHGPPRDRRKPGQPGGKQKPPRVQS